jgi:hypothetical protein
VVGFEFLLVHCDWARTGIERAMICGRAKRDQKPAIKPKRGELIAYAFFSLWRGSLDIFAKFL